MKPQAGARFGRWTVLGPAEPLVRGDGARRHKVLCRCDCGTLRSVLIQGLRDSGSCGCAHREMMRARKRKAEDRFWEKVGLPDANGCRLWLGAKSPEGYGCEPAHVYPGTQLENIGRSRVGLGRGRSTAMPRSRRMTPQGARMVAERRTREHIQRKAKEAAVTHEVEVCVKGSVTVRVQAPSQEDAEGKAMEQVTDMLTFFSEVSYQEVHRTRAIPAEPAVRTVMVGRDIGGGCVNDEGADL